MHKFNLLLVMAIVATSVQMLQAEDWPQWRGPDRNAQSTEKLGSKDWNKAPPKHLWTQSGYGTGYASVSVVDGVLYTVGNTGVGQAVIAADAKTGEIKWKKEVTSANPKHSYEGARCTPSVDGDKLYVISSDGALHCLKKADGSVLWTDSKDNYSGKMMSSWGYSESPLVDGENVLWTPGGEKAEVVCLNKTTGKLVWKCAPEYTNSPGKPGAGYSSIVISNAQGVKQYVQLTGRGVIGIDATNGTTLWNYTKVVNDTANIPTCLVKDNYVFASTSYGAGACLIEIKKQGGNLEAVEKYFLPAKVFNNHHGGMILLKDHVYAGHNQNAGLPTCINLKSGDIAWGGKLRGPGEKSASVLYIDGQIIFRYENGIVALIEATPKGYKLNGSFTPDYQKGSTWAHPVVVDGKLYLREQDKLMCYQVGP